MEYNAEFYKHCLGILIQTIYKEFDDRVDLITAWHNYMWYPIEESHAEEFLKSDIVYFKDKACEFVEW